MKSSFGLPTIERFLNNVIGAILVLGMMLLIVADVTGRYLFNRPVQGTMELTVFIMVGMVFLTIGYTQAIKAHINIEILTERMSFRMRKVFELIAWLLGLGVYSLIAWQGVNLALESWKYHEYTDGLIPFPTLPAKLTVPIGSILLCLRFILDIVNILKDLKGNGSS